MWGEVCNSFCAFVAGAGAPGCLGCANPACTLKIVRMIGQQLSLCFVPRTNLPGVAFIGVKVLPAYAANVLVKDSGGLRVACCLHVSISWLVDGAGAPGWLTWFNL